ncbi:MAG TPA: hypothetical protein VMI73_02495 [Trebonia sp.]|nr:hypothetical protein [Trebonia sp.]
MNVIEYDLPDVPVDAGALEEVDAAADALEAAALLDAAVDEPDAAGDELDDEHAAVTPSSNAAVAPAAGTDKDRFILLRSALGNFADTYDVMVRGHVTDVKKPVLISFHGQSGILAV